MGRRQDSALLSAESSASLGRLGITAGGLTLRRSSSSSVSPELSALTQRHFDYAAFFSAEVQRQLRQPLRDRLVRAARAVRVHAHQRPHPTC